MVAQESAVTPANRRAVVEAYPEFMAVAEIRGDKSRLRRERIEALILARRSVRQIAQDVGLDEGVVTAYRALYWSFGTRINEPEYVVEHALRRPLSSPRGDRASARRRATMNAVAYFMGPQALGLLTRRHSRLAGTHWRHAGDLARHVASLKDLESIVLAMVDDPATPFDRKAATAWLELEKRLDEGPLADVVTHVIGMEHLEQGDF